jgi:hypothetical protein
MVLQNITKLPLDLAFRQQNNLDSNILGIH